MMVVVKFTRATVASPAPPFFSARTFWPFQLPNVDATSRMHLRFLADNSCMTVIVY